MNRRDPVPARRKDVPSPQPAAAPAHRWGTALFHKPALRLAALAAGVLLHAALGYQAIRSQSPTFDEPLHLAAGAAYWRTGDYRVNGLHHPPLSSLVAAAPLLFMDAPLDLSDPLWTAGRWDKPLFQYGFADRFLYRAEGASPRRRMAAGRTAILLASCLFLLALYAAGREFFGPAAGWTAFFLGAFSPTLLAHGTLVTTDFLFGTFFFLFFACFGMWEKTLARRWAVSSGVCLGLAFCSKFSAVAVVPVLGLWILSRRLRIPFPVKDVGIFLAAAFGVVALVYQGQGLPVFWDGLGFTLNRIQEGRAAFLWGRHGTTGWWYYFPAVFLIKTPLPLVLGAAAAGALAVRRKISVPWFLLWPPAAYFALACFSSVQIGHRYILPVEIFLFLWAGAAAAHYWPRRAGQVLIACLGLWFAAGAWRSRPFFLSYFNELIPRGQGYKYVTDSNLDWGQGLLDLKRFMDQAGVRGIYLSYFGTADPRAYGIEYEEVAPYGVVPRPGSGPDGSLVPRAMPVGKMAPVLARGDRPRASGGPALVGPSLDLRVEPRALLAVSVTNFQSTYFADPALFAWLKDLAPETLAGGSILVFDVTRDTLSHERLAGIFDMMGKSEAAGRERAWARTLKGEKG